MHDIRWIRDNPDAFDAAMEARYADFRAVELIKLDDERRHHVTKLQEAQGRRNAASKAIGKAKASGDEDAAQAAIAEVSEVKAFIQSGEERERDLTAEINHRLAEIPNIPHDDVPIGKDEDSNVLVRNVGTKSELGFEPRAHYELGEALGQMDFDTAAKISGSRFVILQGQLARLERAIGQFMIDLHTQEHGMLETAPPLLVRDDAVFGTTQLPKFKEDLFRTDDGRWLIPTAEVPLTNLVRESILDEASLPLRFTALTPCFRSEAGSAGRDTRGMFRQHQFSKVEMVSITTPDASHDELERMTGCAEEVLKQLGLAYRVMKLCTGDMGFGARRTYDIEVWLPGQDNYREISSCSVCGDFQARRMSARYRIGDSKKIDFVHTLNGSGLAVGRTLIAVMEYYQRADGGIDIPEILLPYMGGITAIEPA
ncbi:MAG: serine--tRNA ligase [Rhizobiales bacterium]|nr:serine--tRNA ligase [Hyphomicrobiales bacterium]